MTPTSRRQLQIKLDRLARDFQWEQGYTPSPEVTNLLRRFSLEVLGESPVLLNALLHYRGDKSSAS